MLYVRGGVGALAAPGVAVVGARSCSAYGAQVARAVARDLAAAGVAVVSGLARGVDGEAHRGALESGGQTIAVLGCGIDRDYPRSHAELARRIAASGAVVSEYPAGVEPAPWRFPARNRIIAGLSLATVVVEARERSGALITADFALELGRDVFAVPGEITSALSAGTNDLLRQGAAPLTAVRDVFDALGIETTSSAPAAAVSDAAAALLVLLGDGAAGADELARASGFSSAEVAAALVELELAGLAAQADGVYRSFSPGRSRVARTRA
jgi:DNA processing protein